MTRHKAQILLVDDHPLVCRGVAELINGEIDMEICGEVANAHDALAMVKSLKPELVIIDVSLPRDGGIELMKTLSSQSAGLPLLAYSMHDETIYAERCFRAGATGYVMKSSPPEMLLAAIRRVLEGKTYMSDRISERLLGKLVGAGRDADLAKSPVDKLSNREREVLQLLGNGKSTAQAAETLGLSIKTVETYREHVKRKLNLANGNELLRYAVEWTLNCSTP